MAGGQIGQGAVDNVATSSLGSSVSSAVGSNVSASFAQSSQSGWSRATSEPVESESVIPAHEIFSVVIGKNISRQLITEYEDMPQITSRTFFSLEESWDMLRGQLIGQPKRYATISVSGQAPLRFFTSFVEDLDITDGHRDRYLNRWLYRNYPRASDVDEEISKRVAEFIEANPLPHADPGSDDRSESPVQSVKGKRKTPPKKYSRDSTKKKR